MIRQSRRRGYKTKRERLADSLRNLRMIFIFALIALAGWLFFNRVYIYDVIRTSF